jgi:hypothetical protein
LWSTIHEEAEDCFISLSVSAAEELESLEIRKVRLSR